MSLAEEPFDHLERAKALVHRDTDAASAHAYIAQAEALREQTAALESLVELVRSFTDSPISVRMPR